MTTTSQTPRCTRLRKRHEETLFDTFGTLIAIDCSPALMGTATAPIASAIIPVLLFDPLMTAAKELELMHRTFFSFRRNKLTFS
jgi:hypothetical protein